MNGSCGLNSARIESELHMSMKKNTIYVMVPRIKLIFFSKKAILNLNFIIKCGFYQVMIFLTLQ